MARLAGVSEATVSRVLNGVGPIKEETRQRVLEAAAALHYVPSAIAQQFARRRSGNLGIILPLLPKVNLFATHYFSELLSGIGATAKQEGYDLLLFFQGHDEPRHYDRLFQAQKIDACIILGAQDVPAEREALKELHAASRAFCLISQRYEDEPYNTVDADHASGVRAAVKHLLEKGYERIGLLNGPSVYSNSRDRLEGFRQALAEQQLAASDAPVLIGNYSRKSGYSHADQVAMLIRKGELDAIVAGSDRMAIGLLQGLKEHGLTAGIHYGLVGCDDSEGSRLTDPALTSLTVPFYEAGSEAAARLLTSASDEEAESGFQLKLPVQLVVRGSSAVRPL
ncbi:LacI family transcriptional regulator [Paenibacillus phyllosphaerae]|uniref:LacI family transcriptional regulator n=1 Tax=Paenibacillus phyllosphaerae TaxID=274593 RepID=A0A7W5B5D4_9BACL|nr:LacI family transcriptional regulator [Paenibacillus phyllosphaerae]